MKYWSCPPDLPFGELLFWHLKNFGAVMVIILVVFAVVGIGALVLELRDKLRGRR